METYGEMYWAVLAKLSISKNMKVHHAAMRILVRIKENALLGVSTAKEFIL